MFSFMAALRSLVLPFGTLTGTRIVLDGVNGRISMYNAADVEIIREDSATGTITATGTNGSSISLDAGSGSSSHIYLNPPTLAGHTWELGDVATFGTTSLVGMRIASPYDQASGVNNYSQVTLLGGSSTSPDTSVVLTADAVHVEGGTLLVDGATTFSDAAFLSNGQRALGGNSTTETQQVVFGSSVPTTNGTGQWTIVTGLNPLRGFVAWNGDVGARPNMVIGNNRGNFPVNTTGSVSGTCYVGNTGATINNLAVRIDWIAFGV